MLSAQGGSLSSAPNGRIIDFEAAELRQVPFQDGLYLWVRGQLPAGLGEARLAPRIYHGRPDYWGIEVTLVPKAPDSEPYPATGPVEAAEGAGQTLRIFEQSVPLTGITGSRGIAVIGANLVKRIDITGKPV